MKRIFDKFLLGVNLVSVCWRGSIFGGGDCSFILESWWPRLLSPRSPITQFELTLPVEGAPRPEAAHSYNSRNTKESLGARTRARSHARTLLALSGSVAGSNITMLLGFYWFLDRLAQIECPAETCWFLENPSINSDLLLNAMFASCCTSCRRCKNKSLN